MNNFSGIRILICNDDGVNSCGIRAMERIAQSISPDVWIVGPNAEKSGFSQSVTLTNNIRINEISPRRFEVTGTPCDCIIVGVRKILKDRNPDLILTGINHGHNLGGNVNISGTVGAAIFAASIGIKSIAISQDCSIDNTNFTVAEHFLPNIIKKVYANNILNNSTVNINVPNVSNISQISGVKIIKQSEDKIEWKIENMIDPRGLEYHWITSENYNHRPEISQTSMPITISPLKSEWTDYELLSALDEIF